MVAVGITILPVEDETKRIQKRIPNTAESRINYGNCLTTLDDFDIINVGSWTSDPTNHQERSIPSNEKA